VKALEQGGEITAERVLHLVRSRMIPEIPREAAGIQSTSATRIVETFRARLSESANPFDVKARRRLKQEAVVLWALVFAALALAVYFNLNAMAR
jgi:hypothetical protein